jgi:subtilisin-like proprotein convertase family protein
MMSKTLSRAIMALGLAALATACGSVDKPGSAPASTGALAQPKALDVPDFTATALNMAIPDEGGPAVIYEMPVRSSGLVGGVRIKVDITHTYVGDLVVSLEDPTGAIVPLHDRVGGSQDNIHEIFGEGGTAIDVTPFLSHEAEGTWKLHVDDNAGQDVGTLDAVELTITKV